MRTWKPETHLNGIEHDGKIIENEFVFCHDVENEWKSIKMYVDDKYPFQTQNKKYLHYNSQLKFFLFSNIFRLSMNVFNFISKTQFRNCLIINDVEQKYLTLAFIVNFFFQKWIFIQISDAKFISFLTKKILVLKGGREWGCSLKKIIWAF